MTKRKNTMRFLHIGIRKALIVKKTVIKDKRKKTFKTNHMYKAYGPMITFKRWHGVEQQINQILKIKKKLKKGENGARGRLRKKKKERKKNFSKVLTPETPPINATLVYRQTYDFDCTSPCERAVANEHGNERHVI